MKILFCIYDDINYEARAQEELQCLKRLGNVSLVSIAPVGDCDIQEYSTGRKYISFVHTCRKTIKREKPDLVFLHDNYCANLIPYIKKYQNNSTIIYDMSELYIGGIIHGIKQKVAHIVLYGAEYKYLRYVDGVIAANKQRADIAKGYFSLRNEPIVFDNMHKIEKNYNEEECNEAFGTFFVTPKYTLLYAGGLLHANERGTYDLMRCMDSLGYDYQLIIAGKKKDNDEIYDEIMKNNSYKNIHYVGMLSRDKLKYLYQKSDINIVTFNRDSINNIFCASGKQYEGLFEGTPLLVSDNPPLRDICKTYGVGIVINDYNFVDAIKESQMHIYELQKCVQDYISNIDYNDRLNKLYNEICRIMYKNNVQEKMIK